jgi:hypothetical protein
LHEVSDRDFERSRRELHAEFASLRAEIGRLRTDLIRWMFIVWIATVVPLGGLIVIFHRGAE